MSFPNLGSACPIVACLAVTLLLIDADRDLVSAPPVSATSADEDSGEKNLRRLISQLRSETYQTRVRSARRLVELASDDSETEQTLLRLLRDNPYPPPDLELYLSKKRLLGELESRALQLQLERFLHDPSFERGAVAGWHQFRAYAGDSLDARLVYARAVRERPGVGQQLAASSDHPIRLPDLAEIDRHDIANWSIVLCAACQRREKVAGEHTMRLTASLRNPGNGPQPIREHEGRVVSRLVASFLARSPIDLRDRIVIGLRYDCAELIESDCRRVLNDPSESPSRIVTALLAASASNFAAGEIDQWIETYRRDSRVSHVWRSMVVPKTTHRTQVRDVALALTLHRSGIDPRTRGFGALVADPILVFRPYSLGFESDQARRHAELQD